MSRKISRKIITLILALAFSCGLITLIAVPVCRDLKIAKLEIETERENKTVREEFLSRIIKFRKMSGNVQKDDLEKINQILLSRNGYEDYLSRVIYLAQINNIVVKDFSISQSSVPVKVKIKEFEKLSLRESPEFRETKISFSALGDFSDFMGFMGDFEKMGPLADEDSLKITTTRNEMGGDDRKREELFLSYEVDFKFYY